ncbi:MAG: hypothetical protein HC853_14630 [Anaerolineae bacterium]|nr:hypothetical protein [Anaerolineae bacterium]
MFSGRRMDLEQWLGEARALWQARLASSAQRARGWQIASALMLITAFFVGLQSSYRLPQITLPELPSFILPLVVLALAAALLFKIKPHLNVNLNINVSEHWDEWQRQVAFSTATLHLRISVQIAVWVYRLRDLTSWLVLPRLLPDGNLALLVNFALVSLHTWTSRIQTPRVAQALALHWQSALSEARRLWVSFVLLLDELIEPTYSAFAPALSAQLVGLMDQHSPRSHSPLVINLRC